MSTASLQNIVVTAVEPQGDSVVSIDFAEASGSTLAEWAPGAHIDLRLPSGLIRQYSLCGEVGDPRRYRIGVLLEPRSRGGSKEVHRLVPGNRLQCSRPRNRFPLQRASAYVFIAGGIGITPILPMIAAVRRREVPWTLLYGGRSRRSMAFLEEFGPHPEMTVYPHDEVGRLDVAALGPFGGRTLVYCCGPAGLMAAVRARCGELGCEDKLRVELFSAGASGQPARPFDVKLGADGPRIHVRAEESVLQVLLDAGVEAMYSCQRGECGSCELKVVCGEVDHRDGTLTPVERRTGSMLVCVSRAAGDLLVLDPASL